jgi:serine/arginine repetitive matrix protein 2
VEQTKKFDLSVPFSLPFIGKTSPLFNPGAGTFDETPALPSAEPLPMMSSRSPPSPEVINYVEVARSVSPEPPLTPPRILQQATKEDSPHHIPDFNFEPISLDSPTIARAIATPLPSTPTRVVPTVMSPLRSSRSSELVENGTLASSSSLSALASPAETSGSTNTKVRQRISREMIRKTLEQRKADGSLSKRTSRQIMSLDELEVTREMSSALDNPPPPPAKDFISAPMRKAATTDGTTAVLHGSSTSRPQMRPRSQTQTAHDMLIESERKGELDEPKSALDRLMRGEVEGAGDLPVEGVARHDWLKAGPSANDLDISDSEGESTSAPAKSPAPLLAPAAEIKPMRSVSPTTVASDLMAPPQVPEKTRVPSDGPAAREAAIVARRKEKGGRDVSSSSRISRRRSLSTGDAEKTEPVRFRAQCRDKSSQLQTKQYRHSVAVDRRLTLGPAVDDAASFVESFREDTENIGSDVSVALVLRPC